MDYDEQNQFNENMIDDDMNNYNHENNEYNNQYNENYEYNNQYNEYKQYEEDNNNNNDDGNYLDENDLYKIKEDNIILKSKCENLYKSLLLKNKKLEQYKNEYF